MELRKIGYVFNLIRSKKSLSISQAYNFRKAIEVDPNLQEITTLIADIDEKLTTLENTRNSFAEDGELKLQQQLTSLYKEYAHLQDKMSEFEDSLYWGDPAIELKDEYLTILKPQAEILRKRIQELASKI